MICLFKRLSFVISFVHKSSLLFNDILGLTTFNQNFVGRIRISCDEVSFAMRVLHSFFFNPHTKYALGLLSVTIFVGVCLRERVCVWMRGCGCLFERESVFLSVREREFVCNINRMCVSIR